ncbi:MAG: acetate uptake transporter [Candidatus Dormibacteria bacterium]|nr:acetate uptake transporter [Candidatus Saccharimonadales bacterium]
MAAPAPSMAAAVIANPAPLGLVAFGLTTLLLSFINAGVIPGTSVPVVLATAIPFGGLCQLLAGMWEFRTGNTFGATAFTSYGAFWISFVLINTTFGAELPKDPTPILGLYALAWGIFTLYMFAASLGGASRAVSLVFLLLALTFFALAIGFWGHDAGGTGWTQIGGILGILTAVAAMYTSFAGVLNANFKRTVLPI